MALLAQINLKDLAGRAPPGKLPATGWLYFFYSMEASTWGYDPKDADSFAVLYHDGPLESLTRAAIPTGYGEAARSFSPSALSFTAAVDLPDPEDRRFPTELLSPGENEKYDAWYALNAAVRDFDENRSPGHQECELVSKGTYTGRGYVPLPETEDAQARIDAWNLLLQLDSDRSGPGWMWGDMGRIYLWIRDEDLAARRFDRSWMHLYCY